MQNPFLESVVSVSKRSLEEILPDAAQDFDAFYRQRSAAHATGSILVAAVDGKGIPMVKPGGARPTGRLPKGQKANKKRMATHATVFTRAPWVRTPQQIIESPFPTRRRAASDAPALPRPENKRVWASLLKGKTAVIHELAEEMDRRDPFHMNWPSLIPSPNVVPALIGDVAPRARSCSGKTFVQARSIICHWWTPPPNRTT